jgi:hypothetical protein
MEEKGKAKGKGSKEEEENNEDSEDEGVVEIITNVDENTILSQEVAQIRQVIQGQEKKKHTRKKTTQTRTALTSGRRRYSCSCKKATEQK